MTDSSQTQSEASKVEERPGLSLRFAVNPFDHIDLLRAGIREWAGGADAAICGKRFPVWTLERLFLGGLGSGTFDLLLVALQPNDEVVGVPVGALENGDPCASEEVDRVSVGDTHLGRFGHDSLLSHSSILGFAIVSTDAKAWLLGHLVYFKPEYRGKGLMPAYLEAVVDLARSRGLVGHRFLSTRPAWKGCKLFSSELYMKQKGGPDVYAYWKVVR